MNDEKIKWYTRIGKAVYFQKIGETMKHRARRYDALAKKDVKEGASAMAGTPGESRAGVGEYDQAVLIHQCGISGRIEGPNIIFFDRLWESEIRGAPLDIIEELELWLFWCAGEGLLVYA